MGLTLEQDGVGRDASHKPEAVSAKLGYFLARQVAAYSPSRYSLVSGVLGKKNW